MANHRKLFDHELSELKEHLLKMGASAENAIKNSIIALVEKNEELAKEVIEQDYKINTMEKITDDTVVRLITQQQPVAKDLRRLIIAFKMNASFERMGDLARNIAKTALRLEMKISDQTAERLLQISDLVQKMVHNILQAYADENEDFAKEIALEDHRVDALYKNFLNFLFCQVDNNAKSAEQATQLAFVGRHLERIGDHVTNIAELLVYLEEAKRLNLNK